jgi:cytidyltransferase-like protein
MDSLLILEQLISEATNKKELNSIVLLPGAFKPPHAGHMYMVEEYAKAFENVLVLISNPKKSKRETATGKVIDAEISKQLWDIFIGKSGLPNVQVEISDKPSPVAAVFDKVHTLRNKKIILGVSKKDDDIKRFKSAEKYVDESNELANVKEYAISPFKSKGINISASDIRNKVLDDDYPEYLKTVLPKFLSKSDIENYIKIIT